MSGLAAADHVQMGSIPSFDYDSPSLDRQFYLIHHRTWPHSPGRIYAAAGAPPVFSRGRLRRAAWKAEPT